MLIKRIAAVFSAMLVMASAAPSSAFAVSQDAGSWSMQQLSNSLINTNINSVSATFGYTVDDPATVPAEVNVKKFDLRNVDGKNYVTSVKNQGGFSSCWAFSATAAAETSMLYEAGIDLNSLGKGEKELDLSELHLAWFSANPVGKNDLFPEQEGEGNFHYGAQLQRESANPDLGKLYKDIYSGGNTLLATTLYSTMQGPVPESLAPYDRYEPSGVVVFANTVVYRQRNSNCGQQPRRKGQAAL